MNEVLKVLLVFLPIIFAISQIRIIKRLRKMKKNKGELPGVSYLAEALEGICLCMGCCAEASSDSSTFDILEIQMYMNK